MAKKLIFTDLAVNAQANATAALMDNGALLLCDGPMRTGLTHISSKPPWLIASLDLDAVAFNNALSGLVETTIIKEAYAIRKGKPTWACMVNEARQPVLFMTAGTGNVNLVLDMPQGGYEEGDKIFISGVSIRFPRTREEMK